MRCNPGGLIDPADVVGRDGAIARLWEILDRQSILLTAERRMGKTSVLRKMELEGAPDRLLLRRDLDAVHSLDEFVRTVYEDVETHLTRQKRAAERTRRFLDQFGGSEVKGLGKVQLAPRDWKPLLAAMLGDLVRQQKRRLVLLWDEFPMMLENIRTRSESGPMDAMELLDTLRALRQEYPELRMILTGSIGLHHVIASLKRGGYANAPVNDLYQFDLLPLDPGDSTDLAQRLLEGKRIRDNGVGLPAAVATAGDHVPFYIHHLVDQLPAEGVAGAAEVDALLLGCLCDAADPWQLPHFRDRLRTYYGPEREALSLRILDTVAAAEGPLPLSEVLLRMEPPREPEAVREMLASLGRDHYLQRTPEGAFVFRLALLRRWWRLDRGL